ncbi:hypothetical protein ATJ97_3056 [Georgenia soli]|uniref:PE-PGRS family protein n=1 Tax=Georgenia soli TaxID=638953 RepID=A0A2A9EPJ5_9MICO|nr:DUF6350 family protein [Georgenia soli]PFG40526.1 hypothetical protein ATJ97_3056 [Georgenia soli]
MPADTRVPHVIDVPTTTPPARRLPEGWLRGLVGGVEAAVLSWLTLVVPAVAAYVATAAAPALGSADWQTAARTGTALWLLAHGGSVTVGGGEVSLPPLGLTLISLALVYGATRRMRLDSYVTGACAVLGFLLAMLVASLVAGPGVDVGALAGGAALAVLGVGLGVRRAGTPAPRWWTTWRDRVPAWVSGGLHGAGWALAGLVVLAVVALAVGTAVGWDRVRLVQDAYVLDVVSTVVMVLAQLLYLPTLLVWALSWVAGPGFAVGTGTSFAPGEVLAAPLPAVPALGALPSPEAPGPQWVVVAPVLVGVVVGVLLHRRRREPSLARAAGGAAVAALGAALAVGLLVLAAAGSIGPGRMADVGADPLAVAGMVVAEVGAGAFLTVVALHPRTAELVVAGVRGARERVGEAAGRQRARRAGGTVAEDTASRDAAQEPSSHDTAQDTESDDEGAQGGAHDAGAHRDRRESGHPGPAEGEGAAGGTAAPREPAGRPTGRWHAVTSAETPADPGGPGAPGEVAATPRRAGRDGAPSAAPGRWSGLSLSDWESPERD